MGLIILCGIFLTFLLNVKVFHIILSVPLNSVMDLNNVMHMTLIMGVFREQGDPLK